MRIAIIHNRDLEHVPEDPGRIARADVLRVKEALASALKASRHEVELFPVVDTLEAMEAPLMQFLPDVVLNVCESIGGDSRGETAVPEMLEKLGLPYTGSDAVALSRALHKGDTKAALRVKRIATPDFWLVETVEELAFLELRYPLMVKPSREDASVGIDFDSVVHDYTSLSTAVGRILKTFNQPALVESFIEGREINVAILGHEALPLTEIQFGKAFEDKPQIVSYRAKWEPDSPEYQDSPSVPCVLDRRVEKKVIQTALSAFEAIGARDYGRVDIRLDKAGKPWVIDLNPNCDLHPEAGFSKAANLAGMSYDALVEKLIHLALERHHAHSAFDASGQRSFGFATPAHRNVHPGRGGMRS